MFCSSSDANCAPLNEYLVDKGYVPSARAKDGCVVFDIDAYNGKELSFQNKQTVERRCGVRPSLLSLPLVISCLSSSSKISLFVPLPLIGAQCNLLECRDPRLSACRTYFCCVQLFELAVRLNAVASFASFPLPLCH